MAIIYLSWIKISYAGPGNKSLCFYGPMLNKKCEYVNDDAGNKEGNGKESGNGVGDYGSSDSCVQNCKGHKVKSCIFGSTTVKR